MAITIFIFFIGQTYAQQKIKDSIEKEIEVVQAKKNFSVKDTTYIKLLNNLGKQLRFIKTDSLFLLSQQAFKYSKSAGYKKGEAHSLILMSRYYSDKGDYAEAINYCRSALSIANELKDSNLILNIQNDLAGQYAYMGDYAKALNVYLISLEFAERVDNKLMLSIINENVANLYASQKDYDQALSFYKKVKSINDEIGNDIYSAETMSNIASIYADIGNLDYAMFNINKSITIFEAHNIIDWLAYAYEVKGKTYLKKEKYIWALHWYHQAEMIHDKIEDDRSKIDLVNGMAEAYYGLKRDSISEIYALEAYEISSRIKFKEGIEKCAKTLYKISKNKKDYVNALKYHELFQAISDTLSRNDNKKGLTMLKTQLAHDRQKEALILQNEKALRKQRSYIYGGLVILLILGLITFLVYRNEKTQKKLNKELHVKQDILENRKVELKGLNNTKDKLFSIIGHDLRGPIAALEGLLKLFKDGEMHKNEFLKLVPKLWDDVSHISFTLNNLLSWGQTQMNGAVTKPKAVNIDNIVEDNVNLLSEIANKKAIRIVNRISENIVVWADKNQVDIIIRNLMSNALKFTPENGMIVIEAKENENNWEICVRDTGIGMTQEVQEKLFIKNSNFTTYGTNNEKGTGLGLSLCIEMVENNKGEIWVASEIKKGTSFFFTLPKAEDEKKYKNVG
ncbi:signal transduction histidine kinase/tetratricopeptide (TPR) repeat protein [Saonia flava]|uniref:histidine kinase n=1 Tax=Saonia flava TaxID=523696 RepID=A0A846QYF1_9FLAO|nr:tetratricopeptide repeat-containing sensor histidine kinase [Saonia flava]NJB70154.1 signal transduction histidine kinase/tetratricopeptide (TPR) repeat protein [Saonia flava]